VGKTKAKFSTSSILKKKIQQREFWNKNIWRNIIAKQKPCGGNTVAIYNFFYKKKTTKQNSQPAQYEKKNKKEPFWEKIHKKKEKKII
jgi:hypothetical protein